MTEKEFIIRYPLTYMVLGGIALIAFLGAISLAVILIAAIMGVV